MQRAAAGAVAAPDVDQHLVARQMLRQGAVVAPGRCRAAALLGSRRILPGLVPGDGLLEILEPELQLVRAELLRPAAELVPQQTLGQQPQLVILGLQRTVLMHGIPEHPLQDGGIVGQRVEVDLHAPMMPDVAASDLPFPAKSHRCYPASSGRRRGTGARHSQPSSSAANCAVDKAMHPSWWPSARRIAPAPAASSTGTGQPRHARSA